MYCIKCGVKLAPAEKQCPLCGTVPYHPELPEERGEPLYPRERKPAAKVSPWGALIVITTLLLGAGLICLLCDLQINRRVTWSGYVIGALLLGYVTVVLPFWFHQPNPVVFVPVGFAAVGLFLLYIDLVTGGNWFLSFAFPLTGSVGLIVTAVVALLRYVRKGKLYIFGGAALTAGLLMPLMELLVTITFETTYFGWSAYPFIGLMLAGGLLIFLAICRPARESMERKFFI